MIGTVVVPLDGSELAAEALPYARVIAERSNAPLHLLQVLPEDAPAEAERQARDDLRRWVHELGSRVQISIRKGDPAGRIIAAAEEMLDPIIVMTTHGRSGLSRWFYGSVADRVVRGAGVPVLLLRSGMARQAPSDIRSILLPLDGSSYAEAAIPYAKDIARAFEARVHLVRVAETVQVYAMVSREPMAPAAIDTLNELSQRMISEAEEYLDTVARALESEGLDVAAHVLEGFPAEQLLAFEHDTDVDLVVMATRARGGLSRMVFGSVAERMLKTGTTPVMMIKPLEEEKEDERGEMLIT